jgi:hypothetical protein
LLTAEGAKPDAHVERGASTRPGQS